MAKRSEQVTTGDEVREFSVETPQEAARSGKNITGIVLGAGLGLVTLRFLVRRRRRKKATEEAFGPLAEIPEQVSEALEEAGWKTWVAGAAALLVLSRLLELRQLKKINKNIRGIA